MAATTCLVIGLLIGPAARRLSGERVPITETERKQMTATERMEALNAARHTLIQAATGLVVIGGVAFTALGLWYTARTVDTAQQGQITDRYTKAVEQLGSAKQDVRLGGIYALQRLADDSPRDRNTVLAVLSAYVRGHDLCTLQPGQKRLFQPCTVTNLRKPVSGWGTRPGADVVAALTVASSLAMANGAHADFSQMRFPTADLIEARLRDADLHDADLRSATLIRADLRGANLSNAHLLGASLGAARLSGADLSYADLHNANLSGADLRGADLSGADLRGASLSEADLRGANLGFARLDSSQRGGNGADLRGANLSGADLSSADLRSAYLGDADVRGANLRGADLRGIFGKNEKEIRRTATVDSQTLFGPPSHSVPDRSYN
ncbi:pentapeptide repeat-containing protein [Nonomuraea sp. NPDC049684]|uniref:pentapeptide repeat-containing protein n=1 Tax=Nonomuraea sp. NPDC049684 TaxID=3364356 RepID=UPI0037AFBCE8